MENNRKSSSLVIKFTFVCWQIVVGDDVGDVQAKPVLKMRGKKWMNVAIDDVDK